MHADRAVRMAIEHVVAHRPPAGDSNADPPVGQRAAAAAAAVTSWNVDPGGERPKRARSKYGSMRSSLPGRTGRSTTGKG